MYFKSVNKTVDQYRAYLEEVKTDSRQLANVDFDTGKPTLATEYPLTDDAYAKLLSELSDRKFDRMSPELRQNILNFIRTSPCRLQPRRTPPIGRLC